MMSSGLALHTKGFESASFYSRMKRLMAAWRPTTEWNTLFFTRRRVSLAKKPSTALSHEHEVRVKWNVQRGWRGPLFRRNRLTEEVEMGCNRKGQPGSSHQSGARRYPA